MSPHEPDNSFDSTPDDSLPSIREEEKTGTRAERLPLVRDKFGVVVIPGYTRTLQIGDGGQGTVYLAEKNDTGDKVAIKMLKNIHDKDVLNRFKYECKIINTLRHEFIVRVYDIG